MAPQFSEKQLTIGTLELRLLNFHDAYAELSRHLDEGDGHTEPPLYGILWPSAEVLAAWLWEQGESLHGLRVLEVGCGLGLPTLVAAALGADVLAMDKHEGSAAVLRQNLALNGLSCEVQTAGFDDPALHLGRFDLIVASDVLYEPEVYPALESFLFRHLRPGGRMVIADPGRYKAGEFAVKGTLPRQKLVRATPSGQAIDLHLFGF